MEKRDDSTGVIQVLIVLVIAGGLFLIASKSGLTLLGGILLMTAMLGQLAILATREGSTFTFEERRPEPKPSRTARPTVTVAS